MPFGARLEPLYRMAFHYSQGGNVALAGEGTEGRHLFLTEGRREARITGLMQGANHPRRRRGRHLLPRFPRGHLHRRWRHSAVRQRRVRSRLSTGRPYDRLLAHPRHRRPRYRWLNDVVCDGTGEVRPDQLFIDVAELVWEPPGQLAAAT